MGRWGEHAVKAHPDGDTPVGLSSDRIICRRGNIHIVWAPRVICADPVADAWVVEVGVPLVVVAAIEAGVVGDPGTQDRTGGSGTG